MKRKYLGFLLLFAIATGWAQTTPFARGADISWCTEMEAEGKVFRNAQGMETDIFALMKSLGMNAIRLRVWVNPVRYGYGAWCDKADVLSKARRAKAQGLDLMIDFHYSDFFADPGNQRTPLDWQGFSLEQVKAAVAGHTKDILQALKDEGIEPKWVQVGNETNSGMVWDMGKIDWNKSGSSRFDNYVAVSNAGYDAVKAVFPYTSVIVHIGGAHNVADWDGWFFKDFKDAGGKFDMIGLSHYPDWNDWGSEASGMVSNPNAAKNVKAIGDQFGVPVMIAETGFSVADPKKAARVMQDLFQRMTALPQCAGIFYWEPQVDGQWKPTYYDKMGWGAYGMGAFTTDGRPLETLNAFKDEANQIHSPHIGNGETTLLYDMLGRPLSHPSKGLHIEKTRNDVRKQMIPLRQLR